MPGGAKDSVAGTYQNLIFQLTRAETDHSQSSSGWPNLADINDSRAFDDDAKEIARTVTD